MKITKKVILSFLIVYILGFGSVFAGGIDHFEVTLDPNSAKVGEALDLVIEAVDKNNQIVSDYNGTVLIFSESDQEAELPITLEDNTYKFISSDQGKVTFENSVKFVSDGNQNIHVYDFNDDTIFGIGESNIIKQEKEESINIDIISPENGLTIGENKITISGSSKKNHQIKIIVNEKNEIMTTTSAEGIYEKEITDLINGDNTFKASVLNGDGDVVGESNIVTIKVETNTISIKNVKTTPKEVDSESSFELEIIATPGLTKVSAIINDVITDLKETEDGIYMAKIFAPKTAETYKIDVILTDELGHENKELGAGSLKVNEIILEAPKEIVEIEEIVEEIVEVELEAPKKEIKKELKIKGLKLVELKTRSILSWNETEGAESYNVYKKLEDGKLELIENVKENKYEIAITGDEIKYDFFAVKAMAKTESGEIYEGSLSDATKVKTGPEFIILLLLSLLIGGGFVILKNKNA